MSIKITDKEFLVMSDLSYLEFTKDDNEEVISEIISNNKHNIQMETFWKEDVKNRFAKQYEIASEYFDDVLTKWKVLDVKNDDKNGLYAVAFQNIDSKEVVISYRGTEGGNPGEQVKDLFITDANIIMGKQVKQFKSTLDFYNKMKIENNSISVQDILSVEE